MTTVINSDDSLEDIRLELGKLIADQTARFTEVARRQHVAIVSIMDRLFELSALVKKLKGAPSPSRGSDNPNQQTAQGIKLHFPRFTGLDPEG